MNKEEMTKLVTNELVEDDAKMLWIEKQVGFGSCMMGVGNWYWSKDEIKLRKYLINVEIPNVLADYLLKKGYDEIDGLYEMKSEELMKIIEKEQYLGDDWQLLGIVKEQIIDLKDKYVSIERCVRLLNNVLKQIGYPIVISYFEDSMSALKLVEEHGELSSFDSLNEVFKNDCY